MINQNLKKSVSLFLFILVINIGRGQEPFMGANRITVYSLNEIESVFNEFKRNLLSDNFTIKYEDQASFYLTVEKTLERGKGIYNILLSETDTTTVIDITGMVYAESGMGNFSWEIEYKSARGNIKRIGFDAINTTAKKIGGEVKYSVK